jgi:hypothetical protein
VSIVSRCSDEIHLFHEVLQRWLCGESEEPRLDLNYMSAALAHDMLLVSPVGKIEAQEELLNRLSSAYGARPDVRIRISDYEAIMESKNNLLARYIETRTCPETQDVRVSTVLFSQENGLPNGVTWRHIHETWLATEKNG